MGGAVMPYLNKADAVRNASAVVSGLVDLIESAALAVQS